VKFSFAVANHASSAQRWVGFFLVAMVCCAGCRREKIVAYRIPKESDALPPVAETQSGAPMQIQYQAPASWKQEAPSGMSLARFSMADNKAELSVMSFPGEGASQLNLINIVRENAGLPPLNDEQLAKLVQTVDIGSDKGSLIDLGAGTVSPTNRSPNTVVVAVFPHGGATWFFKMIGPPEIIAAQKPALLDFLKSVSFAPGSGMASPHGQQFASENRGQTPVDSAPSIENIPDAGKPSWSVPADWHETSPGQMLLAKFVVKGAEGEAAVSVSKFPGDVGGLLANVNRWRGQVGLAPVTAEGLDGVCSSLDVPGGKATLVDVHGSKSADMSGSATAKDTRLIGIIWPRNGETWFYKMMGDAVVTANQKDAFLKFIQSVHY
jgi:hypothetical protein